MKIALWLTLLFLFACLQSCQSKPASTDESSPTKEQAVESTDWAKVELQATKASMTLRGESGEQTYTLTVSLPADMQRDTAVESRGSYHWVMPGDDHSLTPIVRVTHLDRPDEQPATPEEAIKGFRHRDSWTYVRQEKVGDDIVIAGHGKDKSELQADRFVSSGKAMFHCEARLLSLDVRPDADQVLEWLTSICLSMTVKL